MVQFVENLENYLPKDEYSIFIKQYFLPIIKNGTKKYIKNIDVEIKILEVNGILIPISIGNTKNNCYTTSLSGTFKYLLVETKYIKNYFLKKFIYLLSSIFFSFSKILKLDNIIFVNNLLLSTVLYPKLSLEDLNEINMFLFKHYPQYAVFYRSINDFDKSYFNSLLKLKFEKIISRQIYISKSSLKDEYLQIRDIKNDKKIFEKSGYILESDKNYSKEEKLDILSCYNNLYLDKYTSENPQFTEDFIENLFNVNAFLINTLKNNDGIRAVFGYYKIDKTITTPIFGYKDENLYRHISYLLLIKSLKKTNILNQSSGVGQFKMNRGAKKYMEYSFVYFNNLPIFKKIFWGIIIFISNKIGEPILKNNTF